MFSDPMVAVMAMLILCFTGMLVMFIFVVRSLSSHAEEMREAFRKQQMFLADLEKQFMDMSFAMRRMQERGVSPETGTRPAPVKTAEPTPIVREEDGLMTLLEAAVRNKNDAERKVENGPLPSPSVSRPLVEEYDPAKDPHLFDDGFLPGTSQSASNSRQAVRSGRTGLVGGRGRSALSIKLDD